MPYQLIRSAAPNQRRRDRLHGRALSDVAQMVWEGFLGHLDTALVEVTAITEDGSLIPSSSVGNNKTWLDLADRIILEVNAWQPLALEGIHDIYYGTALPPHRKPINILAAADRIGVPHLRCDPEVTSRSSRRTRRISRRRSKPRTRPQPGSPAMCSTSWTTKPPADGFRAACCRCSRCRQRHQCRARRARRRPLRAVDGLHRGYPGQHARAAAVRHPYGRLGDSVLAERPGRRGVQRRNRRLPPADRPATAGEQITRRSCGAWAVWP